MKNDAKKKGKNPLPKDEPMHQVRHQLKQERKKGK